MKWAAALLLSTVLVPPLQAADWIKISSANFQLLTNAPEREARKTLWIFEEARDFFLREQPSLAGSPPPAMIVGFNSFKEYRPYSPKSSVLAYFMNHEQGDYIVLSDLELERMRVAVHEYVHLLVSHSGLSIPLWLNEGMAEVYSTLEERDGKLLLGEMKRDRVLSLGGGNWMRLPELLRADYNSPEYNEANLETMFYAQSCLLVHMLMLGDGYSDKFSRFLERVSATGSSQTAFAEVYGKSTAEIEKQMTLYFRQQVQSGAVYRAGSTKLEITEMRPATGVEVGVTLADLTASLGRTAEARKQLMQLAAQYPKSAEIEGSLAYLEEQSGEKDAALAHYRAALALNPAGWSAYWNYARFLDDNGGDLEPRVQALQDALQRGADLSEARFRLGRDLCAGGRFADALEQLKQIENVEPDRTVAMFTQMAIAAFGLKRGAEARGYAEQAKSAARTPEEKEAVAQLLAQMQMSSTDKTETRPATDPDSDRPTLRRTPAPVPKKGGGGGSPLP